MLHYYFFSFVCLSPLSNYSAPHTIVSKLVKFQSLSSGLRQISSPLRLAAAAQGGPCCYSGAVFGVSSSTLIIWKISK